MPPHPSTRAAKTVSRWVVTQAVSAITAAVGQASAPCELAAKADPAPIEVRRTQVTGTLSEHEEAKC